MVGKGVGDGAVDHLEISQHLVRTAASRVDEDDAELIVQDDVPVHRPLMGRDHKMAEVEPLDLHAVLLSIWSLRPRSVPTAGSA